MDWMLQQLKEQFEAFPTWENQEKYILFLLRLDPSEIPFSEEPAIRDYLEKLWNLNKEISRSEELIVRKFYKNLYYNTERIYNIKTQNKFPLDYIGYILVELDESNDWSFKTLIDAGGYLGSVYLVDMTQKIFIASLDFDYEAYPLYAVYNANLNENIEYYWYIDRPTIEYLSRDNLKNAINWSAVEYSIGENQTFETVEELREYCTQNRLL